MEDICRANALTLAVEGNRSFDLLEFVLNERVMSDSESFKGIPSKWERYLLVTVSVIVCKSP